MLTVKGRETSHFGIIKVDNKYSARDRNEIEVYIKSPPSHICPPKYRKNRKPLKWKYRSFYRN